MIGSVQMLLGCCVDRRVAEQKPDRPELPRGCTDDTCMRLPEGKTCGDCVHVVRCVSLFGATPTDRSCDFFPRRFQDTEST